jgi:PPOX class probable F420-dependent enzyme
MPRLDAAECRRRLAAARHAYLATTRPDGAPHIVPVTFALVEGEGGPEIVSAVDRKPKAGTDLARLRNLAKNPRATVLVDAYDEDWDRLWWVRVDGIASVERAGGADPTGSTAALDALAERYPQYAARRPAGPLIRGRAGRWQGWAATPEAR